MTTHQAPSAATPRLLDPTVESLTAQTPTPETLTSTLAPTTKTTAGEQFALPLACGPVSATIRVTICVSPDRPRVIVCLVGQIDRAIIASADLLADEDLLLADRMLEGLHEDLWEGVDHRWVEDDELREARTMLRSAIREARERAGL